MNNIPLPLMANTTLQGLLVNNPADAQCFNAFNFDSDHSDLDTLSIVDHSQLNSFNGNEHLLPLLDFESMFTSDIGPESTMDWHSRYIWVHFLHLRYACVVFRYHLLVRIPYFSILSEWEAPLRRRRDAALYSWNVACAYYAGRHNMELETRWKDSRGSFHDVNNDVVLETVCLHTSPQKFSPYSFYCRSRRRNFVLRMLG